MWNPSRESDGYQKMSHCPKISLDQSLMARIKDQNKNGMHGKISTTVPNCPKSQIKDAVHNTCSSTPVSKADSFSPFPVLSSLHTISSMSYSNVFSCIQSLHSSMDIRQMSKQHGQSGLQCPGSPH
jgi:hypothetical protein